jgi:precorrin-8X/cobalt-precorrin-8 methylmutase
MRGKARGARGLGVMTTLLARYGLPPHEIEAQSLAYVDGTLGDRLPAERGARTVAGRMVYSSGDLTLAESIQIHPAAVSAGIGALRAQRSVVVDVRMLAAAVETGPLTRLDCRLHVAISASGAAECARAQHTTRSAAGLTILAPHWAGGVVAIGTAPTALLALLDLLDAGAVPPALVVATPVGFVAAAESKAELLQREVPFITVLGTRGGAALAAAALNALARLAVDL